MKKLFIIIVALMLTACATHREITRAEFVSATTRTYDKTSEEVLLAAEKLFKLADGDDFKLQHTEDSIIATRNWILYVVIGASTGTDQWLVKTTKTPDSKTKISIAVGISTSQLLPGFNQVVTMNGVAGEPPYGIAAYDLFFRRLEYLLGLRSEWTTCKMADDLIKQKVVWGNNETLCNSFNMKNIDPRTNKPEGADKK